MSNRKNIPLSVPVIRGNEWTYIKECLDTGWVSSVGSYVDKFEKALADYTGCKNAVALTNGTSALHISLIANGIGLGDEVIVPTFTFIAPVNAVRYCGAEPVFMDSDKDTLCLDAIKLRKFLQDHSYKGSDNLTYNKITKRRIKAVLPVHMFGHPVDMDQLIDIAAQYNLKLIEDATESLGSEYKGRKTGTFGKAGCFSFNGNKIITSGGGGMVVTDDDDFARRLRHLSTQARSDSFEYDHDEIGYNYRLTNIQAALGLAQMEKLDDYVCIKRNNASTYRELLSSVDEVEMFGEAKWAKSNFWFITVKVAKENRETLMNHLIARGIQVRPVWKPVHTLPMYKMCEAYGIETATDVYASCFNLPCSTNITEEDIRYVVDGIKEYLSHKVVMA